MFTNKKITNNIYGNEIYEKFGSYYKIYFDDCLLGFLYPSGFSPMCRLFTSKELISLTRYIDILQEKFNPLGFFKDINLSNKLEEVTEYNDNKILTVFDEHTNTKQNTSNECICDIMKLMQSGCSCGAMTKAS